MKLHSLAAFIVCLFAAFSCQQSPQKSNRKNSVESPVVFTGKLIPVDSANSISVGQHILTRDTITPSGWFIKYYVRDDSTRNKDLYIQWGNDRYQGLYKAEDVLLMRSYFIPEFAGENERHIFLDHGCATSCAAVLTLSKDSSLVAKDILSIVDYDIGTGRVVYLTDFNITNEPAFEAAVVDLHTGGEEVVPFDNLCMSASLKQTCIDTVIFRKNKVTLVASLVDRNDYYREKKVVETKVVLFK